MTALLSIGLVLLACLIGSFGPILIKKGTAHLRIRGAGGLVAVALAALTNVPLVCGVALYVLSMIIFILALRGGQLSVLYPIAATQYIWVCLWAVLFLRERMTPLKWTGICLIIIGVLFVSMA